MFKQVQTQTALATCPGCGLGIPLTGRIFVGKKVACPNCETQLVIVKTSPAELDWVYEEWDVNEDDW